MERGGRIDSRKALPFPGKVGAGCRARPLVPNRVPGTSLNPSRPRPRSGNRVQSSVPALPFAPALKAQAPAAIIFLLSSSPANPPSPLRVAGPAHGVISDIRQNDRRTIWMSIPGMGTPRCNDEEQTGSYEEYNDCYGEQTDQFEEYNGYSGRDVQGTGNPARANRGLHRRFRGKTDHH